MNKKKIWLIDDDPIFRLIFSMTIRKANQDIELCEFEDGKLALEAFKKNMNNPGAMPALLVVDLNMPGMNGWQFLDQLKTIKKTYPHKMPAVFVVSSSIDRDDMEKIKAYPFANDFITKPVSVNTIKEFLL